MGLVGLNLCWIKFVDVVVEMGVLVIEVFVVSFGLKFGLVFLLLLVDSVWFEGGVVGEMVILFFLYSVDVD